MCSRNVSSSCSRCGIHLVTLVTNPVISHELGEDRIVITTNGTNPSSFVTQIFRSGWPSYDSDRKSDDLNFTNRNSWFSRFFVSSNPQSRKSGYEPQTLEYRIHWEIYTPYIAAAGMLLHKMGKLKSSLLL